MSTRVILDCDPGIDDALAIAFAIGDPRIEFTGITTVAGNVGLAKTTANALAVASFAGAPGVPVTAGCPTPLLRPAIDAGHVHGESGLGGAVLPAPPHGPCDGHAIDFIIGAIAAAPGEITLVATGPLTNVALAVRREPRLPEWVRDFVIMGGSAGRGNMNHAAEYNIWADPEAAAIVFAAGWTVRMIGLDVTLRARATAAVQERMRSFGKLGSELLLPALSQYADSDNTDGGTAGARRVRGRVRHRPVGLHLHAGAGAGGDHGNVDLRDDRDRLRGDGQPERARGDRYRRRQVLGCRAGHLRVARGQHGPAALGGRCRGPCGLPASSQVPLSVSFRASQVARSYSAA